MSRALPNPVRLAAAAVLAAAALTTAGAAIAPEAEAATSFRTITNLNGGQNLASNLSGKAVTTKPSTSTLQHWELLFPGSAGSSEDGFGSAFQLKNRATQKCLQDVGKGAQVIEATCIANPDPNSPQLWQHHTAVDRTVNGQSYFFLFNRSSDRVLSRAPEFGNAVPVVSSPKATNNLSAAAALQQWVLKRV
jgi:hypothetical protein